MKVSVSAPVTGFSVSRLPLAAGVVRGAASQFDAVRDDLTAGTWDFIGEHVADLDADTQRAVAKEYRRTVERTRRDKIAGMWRGSIEQEANERLREFADHYRIHDLCLTAPDGEIVAFCDARVAECKKIIMAADPIGRQLRQLAAVLERYTLVWPAPWSDIEVGPCDVQPLLNRFMCKRWWRRQVRRLQARRVEQVARIRQKVGKGREVYCSDWNVKRAHLAKKRNRATLACVEAENDMGDVFTLDELQALGMGNPGNRRRELMVRMRGFETVSETLGHAGEFWTFTTPSRFHRMTVVGRNKKKGRPGVAKMNPKWEDATPIDGQQWLCEKWSRIRAAMDRAGIRCYGFRVAEPHHDGTPHWHLVLFFHPEQVAQARRIARKHLWLSDLPGERGAWRRRFEAKRIDPGKGSATGYLAKYVSKNINGAHVGDLVSDECETLSLADAVPRVGAWASTWGIRQFQQIGGPSVTIWRELRRLGGYDSQLSLFSEYAQQSVVDVVEAADAGDWSAFVMALGGPTLPRAARMMKPAYWIESRQVKQGERAGEFVPGRDVTGYGDPAKGSVFGVWVLGAPILTRFYQWVMRLTRKAMTLPGPAVPAGFDILRRASAPPWSSVTNCTG
jgi:hypothetical protein